MGGVPARLGDGVVLLKGPGRLAKRLIEAIEETRWCAFEVKHIEVDQIPDRTVLDRERAVHIGFARVKAGVQEGLVCGGTVMQPDRYFRTWGSAELLDLAVGADDA